MSGVRADLAALQAVVDRLAGLQQRAESLAGELDRQIDGLHADWRGAAASAHQEAHRRWRAGATRMRSASDELRSLVACAHANYAAAVEANSRMWW